MLIPGPSLGLPCSSLPEEINKSFFYLASMAALFPCSQVGLTTLTWPSLPAPPLLLAHDIGEPLPLLSLQRFAHPKELHLFWVTLQH